MSHEKKMFKRVSPPSLSIVLPCYNESEVFASSLQILEQLLEDEIQKGAITKESKLLFVDDGSSDETWQYIEEAAQKDPHIQGLKLSRNRGHQIALLAGLHAVETEICISIDVDLQDDIRVIPKMIENYRNGDEIVYGVRDGRATDTFFKRATAGVYYALMHRIAPDMISQHADFRLLGPKALAALKTYSVKNLYLRGIIPELGFKSSIVTYERLKRTAGVSHYPLSKMLKLAWNGISSQTVFPLRIVTFLGCSAIFVAFLGFAYTLFSWFFYKTVSGWASLEITIIFFGAVQLLSLGILGEYLAKLYAESINKPLYFVEKHIP